MYPSESDLTPGVPHGFQDHGLKGPLKRPNGPHFIPGQKIKEAPESLILLLECQIGYKAKQKLITSQQNENPIHPP